MISVDSSDKPTPSSSSSDSATASHDAGFTPRLLDALAKWQVPHRYFLHYYVLSCLSSIFWITQLLAKGPAFRFIASTMTDEHLQKSMTMHQTMLCSMLMLIQGGRRLFESLAFTKPSSSRMGIAHWLLGLCFYAGMTTAIWIEGTGA